MYGTFIIIKIIYLQLLFKLEFDIHFRLNFLKGE